MKYVVGDSECSFLVVSLSSRLYLMATSTHLLTVLTELILVMGGSVHKKPTPFYSMPISSFLEFLYTNIIMPMCLSFIASDKVRPRGLEWLIFNKAQNNYAKMFWDSSHSQAWIIAGNGNYTKFDFLKCVLLWSEPSWCSVCTLSVYQELLWSSLFGMSSAVHDQINRLLNGLVGRFLSVL